MAELKARLGWRDEKTEAKWMKETGWTMLSLAAGFNDLPAVTYLVSQPDAAKVMRRKVKQLKPNTPLRKQPFSMLLGGSLADFDCLTAASAFGDVPVIKALLAAGCPANFGAACGIVGCWCEGGVRSGKPENVAAILEHDPSIVYCKDMKGSPALTYALLAAKHCQVPTPHSVQTRPLV